MTVKNLIQSPEHRDCPPEKTSVVKQLIPHALVIILVTGSDCSDCDCPRLNGVFITLSRTNQPTIMHTGTRACQLAPVH